MLPPKYIIPLLLLICDTATSSVCSLLKNNQKMTPANLTSIIFEKSTLFCHNEGALLESGIDSTDFKIVRGNIKELSTMKILASSHGYHLINKPIDCGTIDCNHIDILNLDDFQNIQKVNHDSFPKKQGNTNIQQLVDKIDTNLWLADVVSLSSWSRASGSTGNNSAATWIASKMNILSLSTTLQNFNVDGTQTHNIIGVQTGSLTPDDWYIVGAHMDSRPYTGSAPGAVDNASGCVGVLELARVASHYNFASSLLFICYSGEEQGLIGSAFHVSSLINDGNQSKVKAALIMDMIGYTSNAEHELLLETSSANQWLMDILAQNAAIYSPNLTIYMSTNPFGSDHVPYINNTMHGILSIDDDWNVYPAYHQSNDLPENLDTTQAEYILKANMATLAQLSEIQGLADIIFINGFE